MGKGYNRYERMHRRAAKLGLEGLLDGPKAAKSFPANTTAVANTGKARQKHYRNPKNRDK